MVQLEEGFHNRTLLLLEPRHFRDQENTYLKEQKEGSKKNTDYIRLTEHTRNNPRNFCNTKEIMSPLAKKSVRQETKSPEEE